MLQLALPVRGMLLSLLKSAHEPWGLGVRAAGGRGGRGGGGGGWSYTEDYSMWLGGVEGSFKRTPKL